MLPRFDFEPTCKIRKEVLYAYQEQRSELEVIFKAENGHILCGKWILGFSDWFTEQITGKLRLGNRMEFNYPTFSRNCIKLYLDCLHQIKMQSESTQAVLELMKFLKYEGKSGKLFGQFHCNKYYQKRLVSKWTYTMSFSPI